MPAQPARQPASRRSAAPRSAAPRTAAPRTGATADGANARKIERRRRERHLRRLRRDLLIDFAMALLLTIFVVLLTAGLGVIALLELPVAAAVIGSFVYERRRGGGSRSTRGRS